MRASHIIVLLFIAGGIAVLFSFMGNLSKYENIAEARKSPGKFVQIIGKLEPSTLQYDAFNNPNQCSFTVKDSTGLTQVILYQPKPTDIEKSEKIVLKGKMNAAGVFECKDILLKCPSKYKDEKGQTEKNLGG
jgi:cytochrome c-type biogenesis protein CcmE